MMMLNINVWFLWKLQSKRNTFSDACILHSFQLQGWDTHEPSGEMYSLVIWHQVEYLYKQVATT